jgi:hypothetical protein
MNKAGLPSRSLLEPESKFKNSPPTLGSGVAAFAFCAPLQKRRLEARGVEPLSSSLSAQTSTRLSGDKF